MKTFPPLFPHVYMLCPLIVMLYGILFYPFINCDGIWKISPLYFHMCPSYVSLYMKSFFILSLQIKQLTHLNLTNRLS
jgi:hypothetical protein